MDLDYWSDNVLEKLLRYLVQHKDKILPAKRGGISAMAKTPASKPPLKIVLTNGRWVSGLRPG